MRNFVLVLCVLCIYGCALPTSNHIKEKPILITKKEDIPDINKLYDSEIRQLKVGMNRGQVLMIFPNAETECYPSGVCNMTIFDKKRIKLSPKLADLKTFTTGIVSLLALTCVIFDDECPEALFAMWNVAVASAIERNQITDTYDDGSVALIQWINIELEDQKVTQWAINEPLEQFRPKRFHNKLPPLEESLADEK